MNIGLLGVDCALRTEFSCCAVHCFARYPVGDLFLSLTLADGLRRSWILGFADDDIMRMLPPGWSLQWNGDSRSWCVVCEAHRTAPVR